MFNSNLQNSISAIQQKQQEERQWKEEVLAVLISINEKFNRLLEDKKDKFDLIFDEKINDYIKVKR